MFNLMQWIKRHEGEFARFRKEMGNPFEAGFYPSKEFYSENSWFPTVDVSEGKSDITVKAEIPGVEAKDIDVSLDGRLLTIKGEKKQEKEEKRENYHRIERSYGSFNRSVELPADVDPSAVDATYKIGVLTIALKKTKESEEKKIEVKTG